MVFGELAIHINVVRGFNGKLLPPLWTNPEQKDDGVVLILDLSSSMASDANVRAVKLIYSAAQCVSGTRGKLPPVIKPHGSTALVDAINALHAEYPACPKMVLVTDGFDTSSKATQLIERLDDDDQPVLKAWRKHFDTLARWMEATYTFLTPEQRAAMSEFDRDRALQAYYDARKDFANQQTADVATHVSNLGVEMVVVAIGSEVKAFVDAMTKPGQRVNVAHIDTGATAADVLRQVRAVIRRPRREAGNTVAAPAVTADAVAYEPWVAEDEEAEARAVEEGADATTVGHEEAARCAHFNGPRLLGYIDAVIAPECVRFAQEPKVIREAVAAFLSLARGGVPMPGPLLNGRFGGVFKDPLGATKKSSFNSCLNACLSLLAQPPKDTSVRAAFADDLAAGVVGPPLAKAATKASMVCIDPSAMLLSGYTTTECMYFKFKEPTPHYAAVASFVVATFLHAVDATAEWPSGDAKTLVPWKGNGGEAAFRALATVEANVLAAPAPAAAPEAAPALEGAPEASADVPTEGARAPPASTLPTVATDAGSSSDAASPTAGRKRSYDELEAENAGLQAELSAIKKKLNDVANAMGDAVGDASRIHGAP